MIYVIGYLYDNKWNQLVTNDIDDMVNLICDDTILEIKILKYEKKDKN